MADRTIAAADITCDQDMFRPPIARAMRTLDRSFFRSQIELTAARLFDQRDTALCRTELYKSRDALRLERYQCVRPDPNDSTRRCIVLRPQHDDKTPQPWSEKVAQLQNEKKVDLIPFTVHLDYSYWTYHEILAAILPVPDPNIPGVSEDEVPSSFQVVGHIAHLNLRERYWQYKKLIGELILDKNASIRTVINKVDDVGGENAYRTFKYEVLAGPNDMNVIVKEQHCTFSFNYSRVYWNSRLSTEHERLVSLFQPGEAVCDVMAGIGPFAVPAGRKNVFVAANDLNPDSYTALTDAIRRNRVSLCVKPYNQDGMTFIRDATTELLTTPHSIKLMPKIPARSLARRTASPPLGKRLVRPRVFGHYVMNLPASAITFLPAFIGLYHDADRASIPTRPGTDDEPVMPTVHVYTFSTKSADNVAQAKEICKEISRQLDVLGSEDEITPDTEGTVVHDVRDVAPNKRMFCASFRLPASVAFRAPRRTSVGDESERRGVDDKMRDLDLDSHK